MSDNPNHLNILAPIETKAKMDALHRTVERAAGHPMSRRSALGLGGLMLLGEPDHRLRGRAALALAGAFGRLLGEAIFGDGRNASPAANRSLLAMVADDGPR